MKGSDVLGPGAGLRPNGRFIDTSAKNPDDISYLFAPVVTTQSLTVSIKQRTIFVDARGQNVTITLPKSSEARLPCIIRRLDDSTNVVTVATFGGDTVNGETDIVIYGTAGAIFLPSSSGWWSL